MKKYLEYRVAFNYRVEIDDNGLIIGNPELTSPRFISPVGNTKKTKEVIKEIRLTNIEEREF